MGLLYNFILAVPRITEPVTYIEKIDNETKVHLCDQE